MLNGLMRDPFNQLTNQPVHKIYLSLCLHFLMNTLWTPFIRSFYVLNCLHNAFRNDTTKNINQHSHLRVALYVYTG